LCVAGVVMSVGVLSLAGWEALRPRGRAVQEYGQFLQGQKQAPVDYIFSLFARYDMIILCERVHPEVTQYEMIYELLADPRFQGQAGDIFTEIGTVALEPDVESFLMNDQLTNRQVEDSLRYLAQNFYAPEPLWARPITFEFLRKIHYLNCSLPKERRLHFHPSDIEFRWAEATKESWARLDQQDREKIEAQNIIARFQKIQQGTGRKKALVIMNYHHAFPHLRNGRFAPEENTGGFLMEAFPGKVANVMINSVRLVSATSSARVGITALQEGRWDAAFALAGNPNLGFNFQGSPFGEDRFDYFPFFWTRLQYQDVFTGFVFFRPLEAHRMCAGLPGLIDQTFAEELRRRYSIAGVNRTKEDIGREIGTLERGCTSTYETDTNFVSRSDCAQKINRWLKRSR